MCLQSLLIKLGVYNQRSSWSTDSDIGLHRWKKREVWVIAARCSPGNSLAFNFCLWALDSEEIKYETLEELRHAIRITHEVSESIGAWLLCTERRVEYQLANAEQEPIKAIVAMQLNSTKHLFGEMYF